MTGITLDYGIINTIKYTSEDTYEHVYILRKGDTTLDTAVTWADVAMEGIIAGDADIDFDEDLISQNCSMAQSDIITNWKTYRNWYETDDYLFAYDVASNPAEVTESTMNATLAEACSTAATESILEYGAANSNLLDGIETVDEFIAAAEGSWLYVDQSVTIAATLVLDEVSDDYDFCVQAQKLVTDTTWQNSKMFAIAPTDYTSYRVGRISFSIDEVSQTGFSTEQTALLTSFEFPASGYTTNTFTYAWDGSDETVDGVGITVLYETTTENIYESGLLTSTADGKLFVDTDLNEDINAWLTLALAWVASVVKAYAYPAGTVLYMNTIGNVKPLVFIGNGKERNKHE